MQRIAFSVFFFLFLTFLYFYISSRFFIDSIFKNMYIKYLIELKGENWQIYSCIWGIQQTFCSNWQDRKSKQKISKSIEDLNASINQIVYVEIYKKLYPRKQNSHSFQVHMEHSKRYIILCAIKQASKMLKIDSIQTMSY